MIYRKSEVENLDNHWAAGHQRRTAHLRTESGVVLESSPKRDPVSINTKYIFLIKPLSQKASSLESYSVILHYSNRSMRNTDVTISTETKPHFLLNHPKTVDEQLKLNQYVL
jgi:hypothetical protein